MWSAHLGLLLAFSCSCAASGYAQQGAVETKSLLTAAAVPAVYLPRQPYLLGVTKANPHQQTPGTTAGPYNGVQTFSESPGKAMAGLLLCAVLGVAAVFQLRRNKDRQAMLQPLVGIQYQGQWAMAPVAGDGGEAEKDANTTPSRPLQGSDIRYEPEILKEAFKPSDEPGELQPRTRNRSQRMPKEQPNPEYDEVIYQLKRKLLNLRMMRAINHPDFRSSDMRKAKKMVARLMTAKRFEELRAQGVDPYAEYKTPRKSRMRRWNTKLVAEEQEKRRLWSIKEKERQLQLKAERRAQRRAERLTATGVSSSLGGSSADLPTDGSDVEME